MYLCFGEGGIFVLMSPVQILQGFPGENIFHGDGLVLVKPVENIRAA